MRYAVAVFFGCNALMQLVRCCCKLEEQSACVIRANTKKHSFTVILICVWRESTKTANQKKNICYYIYTEHHRLDGTTASLDSLGLSHKIGVGCPLLQGPWDGKFLFLPLLWPCGWGAGAPLLLLASEG